MVQTAEVKQVCGAASTLLFRELDFGVKSCGEYTREKFVKSMTRRFVSDYDGSRIEGLNPTP